MKKFDVDDKPASMPDNIREIVDVLRRGHYVTGSLAARLVAFLDEAFPNPIPQWEIDARYLERCFVTVPIDAYSPVEISAIAQRIREANRGKR